MPPSHRTITRRQTLALLAAGTAASALPGCCELRGFPKPHLSPAAAALDSEKTPAFLAPRSVNTRDTPPDCIDVHAHFFNASDVTVKGYIAGPVARSAPPLLRPLVEALAPLADAIGGMARTASDEYRDLQHMSAHAESSSAMRNLATDERRKERDRLSEEFEKLTRTSRGRPFRKAYEDLMRDVPGFTTQERRPRIRTLDPTSLRNAMDASEAAVDEATVSVYAASDRAPYGEGILAFVGYMLSSRYSNLLTYQGAFTESGNTIGVRRTLGALVDFDRWLECAPRSAHEDQMKLHVKLRELTGDYMLPIISYNPWTDVKEHGRSLALVKAALDQGYVGVKIYPPNGFRPWGNAGFESREGPTGQQIDDALEKLWVECEARKVPVMAHAGPSMGRDDYHSTLSGPNEWKRLLNATFWQANDAPRVNLGHFGGDGAETDWTARFAELMSHPRGRNLFADLGYWEDLRCEVVGRGKCEAAKDRLRGVLDVPLPGGQTVADRVMYGSDWLMLSKEKDWPSYARQLLNTLRAVSPGSVDKIFSKNAIRCFGGRVSFKGA